MLIQAKPNALEVVAMGKSNGVSKMCRFLIKIIIAPNVVSSYHICVIKTIRKLIFAKIHPSVHHASKSLNVRI
jgi:protoheme ferro-lyase